MSCNVVIYNLFLFHRVSELEAEVASLLKASTETQSIKELLKNNFMALTSSISDMQVSQSLAKGVWVSSHPLS